MSMTSNNYPRSLCVSDKTWQRIKREKPKGMNFDLYMKVLLRHTETCGLAKQELETLS